MTFVTVMNRLPASMAALEPQVLDAVRKTAADIKADAQNRAPFRTGNLRGSGYFRRSGALSYRIGFSAEYMLYVELGTRYMAARPFLIPAWNRARFALMNAMRRITL